MESSSPTNPSQHRTTVEHTPDGWQVICSTCGHTGKPRPNKFDAGEDEIAHLDTGGGPRNIIDMIVEGR